VIISAWWAKGRGKKKYEPLDEFAKKNEKVWDEVVEKYGLKPGRLETYGWPFLYFIMDQFYFDRQYDLSKARSVGFQGEY
jgi:hypothetical protein